MTQSVIVDTNVLVRYLAGEDSEQFRKAVAFFAGVERGDRVVSIVPTVIFETIDVLSGVYQVPRSEIVQGLLSLLSLPNLEVSDKTGLNEALALFSQIRTLSFADCFHAVLAKSLLSRTIISFDKGFDRVPGLIRAEP